MTEHKEYMRKKFNELKRHVFFEILDIVGRVFLLIAYDEGVIIGKRGFLPEEKERGLILVFNKQMKFNWEDEALLAKLVFGSTPENCFIPLDAIVGVFSPDLGIQLTMPFVKPRDKEELKPQSEILEREDVDGKIIDISKMRKKK